MRLAGHPRPPASGGGGIMGGRWGMPHAPANKQTSWGMPQQKVNEPSRQQVQLQKTRLGDRAAGGCPSKQANKLGHAPAKSQRTVVGNRRNCKKRVLYIPQHRLSGPRNMLLDSPARLRTRARNRSDHFHRCLLPKALPQGRATVNISSIVKHKRLENTPAIYTSGFENANHKAEPRSP